MESTNVYAVFCPGQSRAVMIKADSEGGAMKKLSNFLNTCPKDFKETLDHLNYLRGNNPIKMIVPPHLKRYGSGWFIPYLVDKDNKAYYEGVFMCNIMIAKQTVWLE